MEIRKSRKSDIIGNKKKEGNPKKLEIGKSRNPKRKKVGNQKK